MSNHANDKHHGGPHGAKRYDQEAEGLQRIPDDADRHTDGYIGETLSQDDSLSTSEKNGPKTADFNEDRTRAIEDIFDDQFPEENSDAVSEAERLLDERNSYIDTLQRLQADFDNFRKRSQRQQSESKELAQAQLIEKLLPVLDAFDLALNHIDTASSPPATGDDQSGGDLAMEGEGSAEEREIPFRPFIQIGSLLEDTLAKEGLIRIGKVGETFNPSYHDAVSHEPADSPEEAGIIAEVLRSGYTLKDRVLRPAMVKVKG